MSILQRTANSLLSLFKIFDSLTKNKIITNSKYYEINSEFVDSGFGISSDELMDLPTFSPRGGISFCKLGAEDDPDMTAVLKRWANVDPWAANS